MNVVWYTTTPWDRPNPTNRIARPRCRLANIGNTPMIGVRLAWLMAYWLIVLGVGVVSVPVTYSCIGRPYRRRNTVHWFGLFLVTCRLGKSIP